MVRGSWEALLEPIEELYLDYLGVLLGRPEVALVIGAEVLQVFAHW